MPQAPPTPQYLNDDIPPGRHFNDGNNESGHLSLLNSEGNEPSPSPSPTASYSTMCISAHQTGRFAMTDLNDVACDFLIGTFIWYDILSCASLHNDAHLPNNLSYLSAYDIRLDNIMGCENWAMILISQISQLSAWKTAQQALGCLSIKELLARGSTIEEELNSKLKKNMLDIGKPVPHPESASCQRLGIVSSKSNLVITRVFASAALTYLHTVISGAHPALPEIKSSVANTIEAFWMIPSATLLRNLVWPFCITGCMACPEDETWFGRAMKHAEIEGEGCPGGIWKAWEVVQESWRMRQELTTEELAKGVDWIDAMESLGFQILLV